MDTQNGKRGFITTLERNKVLLISLFLAAAVFIVYVQVHSHEFIHWDDDVYVFSNPHVVDGLSAKNIAWALRMPDPGVKNYWHPLTWISHMLDCQLFGLNAGMHHLMNVAFHMLNVVLLFLLLLRATGAVWRSAFAAALFAFHPLNVDSIAWVAERKNLLSTTFWLLTMYAYILYVGRVSIARYLAVLGLFITGLLAKPMLVTLPFVLLLMDYWPLRRIGFPLTGEQKKRFEAQYAALKDTSPYSIVLIEKIPLLAVSFISIYISSLALKYTGLAISTNVVPMPLRISNAIVSYIHYLWKLIWPMNLTFFYPYPGSVPGWQVAGSLLLLAAITGGALYYFKKFPYLIFGWLWFLGTLVPVSGLMQGGLWPEIAERWAYVPFIGCFIAVTWLAADLASGYRHAGRILSAAAVVVIALFMAKCWMQLPYWKDDVTLFSYGIRNNPDNFVAQGNMGNVCYIEGKYEEAMQHYSEALRIQPQNVVARTNLGKLLSDSGKYEEAEAHFRKVLEYEPQNALTRERLGMNYAAQKKLDEALREYKAAYEIEPSNPGYAVTFADLLMKKGDFEQAALCYQQALAMDQNNYRTRTRLGNAYFAMNRLDDAVREYTSVLRMKPGFRDAYIGREAAKSKKAMIEGNIEVLQNERNSNPDNPQVLYKLAVFYSYQGDYDKALECLNKIKELHPDDPDVYYNIACIQAKQNKVDEALSSIQTAIQKGFNKWDVLKSDKDLKNIRDTEAYKNIIAEKGSGG